MPRPILRRVVYFGAYSKGDAFPRSRNQIRGLRGLGVNVIEAHAKLDASFRTRADAVRRLPAAVRFAAALAVSYAVCTWRFIRTRQVEAVVVGHPGYFHIHLARLLKLLTRHRQLPLIYDAFIPLHEALVEDRQWVHPAGLISRLLHAFEGSCLRCADSCLVDTDAHRSYLIHQFGLSPSKVRVVRVGSTIPAPEAAACSRTQDRGFNVIFAGSFIPLQGIDIILKAAQLLKERTDISFTIVGSGQLEPSMRAMAAREGLANVRFAGWLPTDRLGEMLASADVALGIFGNTPKTARVIPSKVYDLCAAGVPFITADTPAIREVFTHGRNAYLVRAGSPEALAEAILELRSDRPLRLRLGAAAFQTGREIFSLSTIGHQVMQATVSSEH